LTRDDIQGEARQPAAIATYLLRKGGKNLYGEPNFRLVWSPNRMIQKGGKFSDWDKNIAVHERGGFIRLKSGLLVPNGHTPIRTVIGIRTVPKYAFDAGWILERWIPPAYYGSVDVWNDRVVPGTKIPLSGPYPATGDYEMCHNTASAELPSISELQTAIDRCEKAKAEHKEDAQQAALERENEYMAEYEAECAKELAESEAWVKEIMKTNYSSSLQMGAHRTREALKLGITEHVGN
jgi:hypothetical protein